MWTGLLSWRGHYIKHTESGEICKFGCDTRPTRAEMTSCGSLEVDKTPTGMQSLTWNRPTANFIGFWRLAWTNVWLKITFRLTFVRKPCKIPKFAASNHYYPAGIGISDKIIKCSSAYMKRSLYFFFLECPHFSAVHLAMKRQSHFNLGGL